MIYGQNYLNILQAIIQTKVLKPERLTCSIKDDFLDYPLNN